MQYEEYARRIIALGARPQCVTVTGSAKFDGAATEIEPRVRARVRRENAFQQGDLILVFGSTRPGDEALAATCWRALKDEFPNLRIVVAPRHLDRLDDALDPFAGQPILRRSAVRDGARPAGERVFFLDTVGELVQFYAIADVAVVGGGITGSAAALGRSWLYMLALIALSGLVYFAAALRLKAILPQDMPGIIRKRMK